MKTIRVHKARYGNVTILRAYCSECRTYALIIDNKLRCCDRRLQEIEASTSKQMSEVPIGRRGPSRKVQLEILKRQEERCLYCKRRFGDIVYRRAKACRLRIEWDHASPYCYSLNNMPGNFVAACHVCNRYKAAHVFNSLEEAQTFLYEKWKEKGYRDLSPVQIELREETPVAEIL